ncbi:MAG: hypothetical protein ACKODY_06015 [Actinomycetota bacterium]
MFGGSAGSETGLQFIEKNAARLVTLDSGIVRRGENAAEIAQIEILEITLGCLGTVEPIGDPQTGNEILGHLQHSLFGHGGFAFGRQCLVRGLQTLTDCLHSLQREFGDGALILGKIGEHRLAML